MLESGYKISDLSNIPVTGSECLQKNKIALEETYMLGYANTIYGIKYNRNNYKIPLTAIREDIKGYIGIESIVAPWTEQMKLWHGLWDHASEKNKSYVYEWQSSEVNHPHYMPQKFEDLENSYYIIRNAPFPYETADTNNRGERGEIIPSVNAEGENIISTNKPLAAGDPHSDSNKIVLKSYVDERLAAKRLIDVKTEFWVRDYDCNYVIRANELIKAAESLSDDEPLTIKIHYPDKFEERVKNNNLEFTLMVEGVETEEGSCIYKPAVTNIAKWEFYNSNGELLNVCWLNKTDEDVIIIPNLHEERLYDNARYILFTFRTITNSVENIDKIEVVDGKEEKTGEYTKASYSVYAACENMLYRNRAIVTINNEIVEHLDLISSDNSIIITENNVGGHMTLDVSVNQDLPEYNIISPDKTVKIETETTGNDTAFKLTVDKQKEVEILSSNTVKVKEIETDSSKIYQFETEETVIAPMDPGIAIINNGGTWEIGTNFFLEAGDNVHIEEVDTDDRKGWRISAEGGNVEPPLPPEVIPVDTTVILKPLPEIIDFKAAKNEVYFANNTASLKYFIDNLEPYESVTTKLYLNTEKNTEDIQVISDTTSWVMTRNGISPSFKPNRLYCISITALPNFIVDINEYTIKARIDWFQEL